MMPFHAGLLICAVIALPLGVINLEDNMIVQIASFLLLIVCEAAWVVQFFYSGLRPDFMPAVNPKSDFSAFGTPTSALLHQSRIYLVLHRAQGLRLQQSSSTMAL